MVMQVDIYGDGDDELLLATATVNFAVINGTTPKLPELAGRLSSAQIRYLLRRSGNVITTQ